MNAPFQVKVLDSKVCHSRRTENTQVSKVKLRILENGTFPIVNYHIITNTLIQGLNIVAV